MDSVLIDYLRSGKAWVLIGSGPSIEMGYPNWKTLASYAISLAKNESEKVQIDEIKDAFDNNNYPRVFEKCKEILGIKRLIKYLDEQLIPKEDGKIYKLIARWPIQIFLTTNYDDEIHKHLAKLGEHYIPYDNSEDKLNILSQEFEGGIFKLHGDLKTEEGLILTDSQYQEIDKSEKWQYWRTKMTTIFQWKPIVIIGHSLTDPNIKHILQAAKRGAGVTQPICWIAPDVNFNMRREYLEKYRIHVIPYDNSDGKHKNLLNLINHINDFIPPRTSVRIQKQIAAISESPLGSNAAAPGFFVFNKLNTIKNFDEKRIDIILAALEATVPKLKPRAKFNLDEALNYAGWPSSTPMSSHFSKLIAEKVLEKGLFQKIGEKYKLCEKAESIALKNKNNFEHLRERFQKSLVLRIKRNYPMITEQDAESIASDIEFSLTGYFREGGLSLATTLFTKNDTNESPVLPSSIIKFITEASTRYDNWLKRQAFCTVSVDTFVRAESAEREYLGRISQGFFAFHSLGVFGETAYERSKHAQKTVWLIDSNVQISALALAAQSHSIFRSCFLTLKSLGIRVFTTEKLFDEIYRHLDFAKNVISQCGFDSPYVIAAAEGEPPYKKSNEFIQGFIQWQAAGNPNDWDSYLFDIFDTNDPKKEDLKTALKNIGIEVIPFEDWPGFHDHLYADRQSYVHKIANQNTNEYSNFELTLQDDDAYKKALPEAEAFLIIKKEKEGQFYVLSNKGEKSPSWFISQTSILNLIEDNHKITWQPEAFINFVSTLYPSSSSTTSDNAFETILWSIAQTGLSILDDKIVSKVFGGIINQANLKFKEQEQIYEQNLSEKYGEPVDSVLKRVSLPKRPIASIQLTYEALQVEAEKREAAEKEAAQQKTLVKKAEKELQAVERYRKKVMKKQASAKRKARKRNSSKKKRKKK